VVAVVCEISQLATIWETFKQALEALAASRPAWLLANSRPYWYERYGSHHNNLALREDPLENQALAEVIGADGMRYAGASRRPATRTGGAIRPGGLARTI
jgi:hypothetical protein